MNTVSKNLKFLGRLKQLKPLQQITMTTNGITLAKNLETYKHAGLDAINISLDTLKSNKYQKLTGFNGFHRVREAIDVAYEMQWRPLKINCVLMKGFNDDELLDFVQLTENRHFDVRFIEYMPFDGNRWNFDRFLPYQQLLDEIRKKWPNLITLDNHLNDTSKVTLYFFKLEIS